MGQPELDWSPDLIEWVYGPPGDEDDEPPSTGEIYRIQEEEDRIRWLPGYCELVEELIAVTRAWHAAWIPGEPYPPEPERHKELAAKVGELSRIRAVAPREKAREETLPW